MAQALVSISVPIHLSNKRDSAPSCCVAWETDLRSDTVQYVGK